MTIAVTTFEAEKMQAGVSGLIGTFGTSSGSSGPAGRARSRDRSPPLPRGARRATGPGDTSSVEARRPPRSSRPSRSPGQRPRAEQQGGGGIEIVGDPDIADGESVRAPATMQAEDVGEVRSAGHAERL